MKSGEYFEKLSKTIGKLDHNSIDTAVELIREKWLGGGQIFTLGNGGSALTSLHFINDWAKSIFLSTGRPFKGQSLASNIGILTAYANDVSYQDIYVAQLKPILTKDDLVIAISGSGNSENVLRAVSFANAVGAATLGLCGYDGGKLKKIASHNIWVSANDMQICEDVHFHFGHLVMQSLCSTQRLDASQYSSYLET
jgi:D-sedoheptulose 7-phosphate isomerase